MSILCNIGQYLASSFTMSPCYKSFIHSIKIVIFTILCVTQTDTYLRTCTSPRTSFCSLKNSILLRVTLEWSSPLRLYILSCEALLQTNVKTTQSFVIIQIISASATSQIVSANYLSFFTSYSVPASCNWSPSSCNNIRLFLLVVPKWPKC